jgi:DNA-binding SARP family transcriptional activator/Tfp pilus assembly protein PilF
VVEIRLLGPVEVWSGGRGGPAGAPQQQTVLAALAVEAGRTVPVERVIDRVWGDGPPAQARDAVAVRITHLRRALTEAEAAGGGEPGGPARPEDRWIVWQPTGYVLRVDPDGVDLLRFRRLAAAAGRGERADADRVALLEEALGLWRGVPLAGLRGEWAVRQREMWGLERLEAAVEWGRAALRLGQHARVVPVMRELTEEHPHSEALAVVAGWALAADGRPNEAAELCAAVAHRLRTELGIDPGADLRRLQDAVLAGEPLPPLPAPPPGPPAAPAEPAEPPAVPAQLPGDVPGFAGRAGHLARLDGMLAAAAGAPTAAVITAISGTAGVGKTALAVHWAHRVAGRFPDGQLYVNLRGFHQGGQVMEPAAAVRRFIEALGVPADRIPPELDAQAALYRSLLNNKRVLVVLDNARDAEQARPLLPGTPTAVTVVTSRNQLTPLVAADGAQPVTLDLLTPAEATQLLARRLPDRVAAEPAAVEEIITRCARLPLALTIAAARAEQSAFPLAAIAAELADAGGRLSRLDAGDPVTQVRAVFSWSYTALSPAAARLFRLLGLLPGPDTSVPAAASLAGQPPAETRRQLTELTRANLLTEHAPGRYTFHDLLRAYAGDLAGADPDDERAAALDRALDHYTHTAHAAARRMDPLRDPMAVPLTPPAAGTGPEQLADRATAQAWLTDEHLVLIAVLRLAADAGRDAHTWQLAWALDTFLWRRGHRQEHATAWRAATRAADRLGDPTAQAHAHRRLAHAYTLQGRYVDAHTAYRDALDLCDAAGDPIGRGRIHLELCLLWERQEHLDQALDQAEQALAVFTTAGHPQGQARALNAVGWYQTVLGDHVRALAACTRALALFQQVGDRNGEADTWDSIGYAHHHLADHTRAVHCYQRALDLYREVGDRYHEAAVLTHFGDTYQAAGNPEAARIAWQQALDLLTDLDRHAADAVRGKLRDLDLSPAEADR